MARFYCFPDFSAYDEGFAEALATAAGEGARGYGAGKEFGMEGHLRLSFCGAMREVTEGIERIRWALDPTAAQRNVPGRPQTGEGLAMNPYLDLPSPAQPEAGKLASVYGLQNHGLTNLHRVYWNLPTASLYEEVCSVGSALTHLGPVVVSTGKHTARAAADKFVVREHATEDKIWWGQYNRPFTARTSALCWLACRAICRAGTYSCRIVTPALTPTTACPSALSREKAWHSLFARDMFLKIRDARMR